MLTRECIISDISIEIKKAGDIALIENGGVGLV